MASEGSGGVSLRLGLREQMRALPDEAFTRLQFLSPATGCFNQCAMCSQAAGRDVWQLTRRGLDEVARALAGVAAERGLTIGGGRGHRPGVLFPYLDNDVGSYPHLDTYAALARDVLRVRLRFCTVGWSERSDRLSAMHRRLVAEYGDVFDGLRFSLTPYTLGWTGRGRGFDRAVFVADLAHALRTYRPLLDRLGHGPATAAVELRFAPLVGVTDVVVSEIDGRHVLRAGPHLLIGAPGRPGPPLTRVDSLDERSRPVYSEPGVPYLHLVCDAAAPTAERVRQAVGDGVPVPHELRRVRLHRFANADGDYWAADPDFHPDGRFTALHLYPRTARRATAGYTDATRWFLNALLAHKSGHGLGRRSGFPDATAADVAAVLSALDRRAARLDACDRAAAGHLREVVIPLVTTYAEALRGAGLPPSTFFSPAFTVDTGQIVNQGRARALFRGLAATPDEPMTPREERGFGRVGVSAGRGPVWRVAPIPFHPGGRLPRAVTGGKNRAATSASLLVEELDPRHLAPVDRETGRPLRRYVLTGAETEHVSLEEGRTLFALPGLLGPPDRDQPAG
ncbi:MULTISPECIES: hypothetical protein [unclassified Streptomyces]|uniref:hypothetical protein n=1 Tax=unclassified Streptomyces TaxID=2593676 RepID=UPI003830E370